jgi:hypothetical protein
MTIKRATSTIIFHLNDLIAGLFDIIELPIDGGFGRRFGIFLKSS